MKNQKGVTLIILSITIIILAIIAGSISYYSYSSLKMNTYYNMFSDIELLDEKIALYYLQNKTLPIDEEEIKSISDLIEGYSPENVNYNPNNGDTLYKINLSQLENLSLNYEDYYIDEKSHTIYAVNGIKIEEELYYTVPLKYENVDLSLYQ